MLAGEIYWLEFRGAGSEPRGRRPALIVQADSFNRSAIRTAIVAAVTSNLRLAAMPGNVRLARGEGNLRRASVVNVSQLATVDRDRLTQLVGRLRPTRLREVRRGLALVLETEPDGV
jgi:mRNA interferase MazF